MNPLLLLAAAAAAYALLMKDDKPSKPSGPTIPVPGGGSVPFPGAGSIPSPTVEPIVLERDCYDENIPDELRQEVAKLLALAPTDPDQYFALAQSLRSVGYPKIAGCLEQLGGMRGAGR